MRDDKTEHRGYPLPHVENELEVDVARLRAALESVDGDVKEIHDKAKAPNRLASAFSSLFAEGERDDPLAADDISAISQLLRDLFIQSVPSVDFWDICPPGLPLMWTQPLSLIPKGFVLADGTNGTPNLMGRYLKVIANSTTNPGGTGGSNKITLTVANLPSHGHTFTGTAHGHTFSGGLAASNGAHVHSLSGASASSAGAHGHTVQGGMDKDRGSTGFYHSTSINAAAVSIGSAGAHTHAVSGNTASAGGHTHTVTGTIAGATAGGTIGNTGSGQAIDIQPEYYEIAIIMKMPMAA